MKCARKTCPREAAVSVLFQPIGSSTRKRIHYKMCDACSVQLQMLATGAI